MDRSNMHSLFVDLQLALKKHASDKVMAEEFQ